MMLLSLFVALVFLYSLVSARLERTVFTAPILFTAAGMLVFDLAPRLQSSRASVDIFLRVAEIGLVMLLFTDASRTNLSVLKRICNLPVRLMSVGMLLTIAFGTVAAKAVFRGLTWWEAGILAAILAPTDAGLGQIIVSSPRVPMRIRQALNVEAGLNDGLSVPFLLFFMAMTVTGAGHPDANLGRFVLEQLGYGVAVGVGVALPGGWLLALAHRRNWIAPSFYQLGVVALPLLCVLASEATNASMFIAAFVAGLAVQVCYRDAGKHSVEFTEEWGQLLNFSVFFLFGLLVVRNWTEFSWLHFVYALLSLTVIRMLPVAISLLGTRLHRDTVLFMGWFGPRGLASIVLGLVYLEHSLAHSGNVHIRLAVMVTVLLSIFAHGFSALPGIGWYAARVEALGPNSPEAEGMDINPERLPLTPKPAKSGWGQE